MEQPAVTSARSTAVLIPVKAFAKAKVRLAPQLSAPERSRLARQLAVRVLRAAGPMPTYVVCEDDEVADWARSHDARVCFRFGDGLNAAVNAAVEHLATAGFTNALVVHADLPLASDLRHLAAEHGDVVIVPDRHDDGTNAIRVPTVGGFRFAYGAGSFSRHRAEAARLGLVTRVLRDNALGWDVDVPADLSVLDRLDPSDPTATGRRVREAQPPRSEP